MYDGRNVRVRAPHDDDDGDDDGGHNAVSEGGAGTPLPKQLRARRLRLDPTGSNYTRGRSPGSLPPDPHTRTAYTHTRTHTHTHAFQ